MNSNEIRDLIERLNDAENRDPTERVDLMHMAAEVITIMEARGALTVKHPQICNNCYFYKHAPGGYDGECHANALTVTGWPRPKPDEWCGQWRTSEVRFK